MTYQPDTETLLAVILGAALATAGGFGERQIERMIQKREKERSAALFFGELLSAMRLILRLAKESSGRGDPFGPITLRFVRAARREADIFDRNRENMLDLRSPIIRARISVLIARIAFSLDGVVDANAEIASLQATARALAANDALKDELDRQIAETRDVRKGAFEFAVDSGAEITALLSALAPLAEHDFGATESAIPSDMLEGNASTAEGARSAAQ